MFRGRGEHLRPVAAFHQLAAEEEGGDVGNPGRLLDAVRHDDHGVLRLQLEERLLDLRRGDRVQAGCRLVQEKDLRFQREAAGDAQALLLAAGKAQGGRVQAVLHLRPEGGLGEAALGDLREPRPVALPGQSRAVDHVLPHGARQGEGQGEDHADPPAQARDVDARRVDVIAVQEDAAGHLRAVHHVVQPVDQAHEGGLSAARRAEEHGDRAVRDVQRDSVQGLPAGVPVAEALDPDLRVVRGAGHPSGAAAQCGILRVPLRDALHRSLRLAGVRASPLPLAPEVPPDEGCHDVQRQHEAEQDQRGAVLDGQRHARHLRADDVQVVGQGHGLVQRRPRQARAGRTRRP